MLNTQATRAAYCHSGLARNRNIVVSAWPTMQIS